jgi:1-acyl-sn-glycerol-3-phosphate acyltransferase
MDTWYNIAKGIVRGYIALFVDSIQVEGRRFLPSGPKIIIANHANVTDGFMLPFIIQEKIHFLIQKETFELPFLGRMLTLADQIPVVIGQGREALDKALEKLDQGHTVAIFPEGQLNHGKDMRRAGAGAAILAIESGAPLVPVGFYVPPKFIHLFKMGRFHDRESTGGWQFGGKCFVHIGEPWYPNLIQENFNYRKLRMHTNSLMTSIGNLVHQAKETAQSYYLE